MPRGTAANSLERKASSKRLGSTLCIRQSKAASAKQFLTAEPAASEQNMCKTGLRNSHAITELYAAKNKEVRVVPDPVTLQGLPDGTVCVIRTKEEIAKNPDRITLDRRGLTTLPKLDDIPNLRLLSLQHNLLNSLEGFKQHNFTFIVFLDLYDNQLEKINCLDMLLNLRILLMGKNRIKVIEGLNTLTRIEVLDLHGNQIVHVTGLSSLSQLKVLNLAGNQISNIGHSDLRGLCSLQELNLRRNRLRKLLGFVDTPNLQKLFLSNNELQSIEDMYSIARSAQINEISIDTNPISFGGDCVYFLVSYLPLLKLLNNMHISDQTRKAAMAWRRNKESSVEDFMDLSSDIYLNVRREDVISNARTNWELLKSQARCPSTQVASRSIPIATSNKSSVSSDFILNTMPKSERMVRVRNRSKSATQNLLSDKKLEIQRTPSQDTENSQNTSSSNTSTNEFFRLPPILVPIINKIDQKNSFRQKGSSVKLSSSLSSIGPNVDSSASSLISRSDSSVTECSSSGSSSDGDAEHEHCEMLGEIATSLATNEAGVPVTEQEQIQARSSSNSTSNTNTSANTSVSESVVTCKTSEDNLIYNSAQSKPKRNIVGSLNTKALNSRGRARCIQSKAKKQHLPTELPPEKDREQGGDYLIEICGRHLNIYGQGALRFIDKPWSMSKTRDVLTVNFNYANFNTITGMLNRLKQRFVNAENFVFKNTNIQMLGQLNALAEVQGLTSLVIETDGNQITQKNWRSFAIYRLSHWGLRYINGKEVTDEDIKEAARDYQSLSDVVLWSLPDALLQPLLTRLQLGTDDNFSQHHAKKWLLSADPALRAVVIKESMHWKKGIATQEDLSFRHKAKEHMGGILGEACNAATKLVQLDDTWSLLMLEAIRSILIDYTQMDMYMKCKIHELKSV